MRNLWIFHKNKKLKIMRFFCFIYYDIIMFDHD